MTNTDFTATENTIEKVLFSPGSRYQVPRYQRQYTWGEDQVEDFWRDVMESSEDNKLFVGSLILNESSEKKGVIDIIDGQQRLITITILMAVVRDELQSIGLENIAKEFIQAQTIKSKNIKNPKGPQNRIICGSSIQDFFQKYIQTRGEPHIENSEPKNPEKKRVKESYIFFKKKIQDRIDDLESLEEKEKLLTDLFSKVKNLQVITITIIGSKDKAYEIFETVNARGAELSVSDLVKVLIFKEVRPTGEEEDIAQQKWAKIRKNVEEIDGKMGKLTKFIRYHWASKYSRTSKRRLFKTIKEEVDDYSNFLEELLNSSDLYNKLFTLEDRKKWKKSYEGGGSVCDSLDNIHVMRVTQCYVLFLSILRNYEKLKNLNKVKFHPAGLFELIEDFSFVYSKMSDSSPSQVEKIYSRYAVKLESILSSTKKSELEGKLDKWYSDFCGELLDILPEFEEFKENFKNIKYKKSSKSRNTIKYIFSRIEDKWSTGEKQINFGEVNIEHLLPQHPSEEWGINKDHIDYANRIGNLTLVKIELNSKAGNKGLESKIKELKESNLKITQKLIDRVKDNNYEWKEEDIVDREEDLAQLAYKQIWNIEDRIK